MSMIRDALQFILDLNTPETVEVDGRVYTPKSLSPVKPAQPSPLKFNSLEGLMQFASELSAQEKGFADSHGLKFHVVSEDRVELISELYGKWEQRDTYAIATLDNHGEGFTFGRPLDNESFIIGLQAHFVQSPLRAELLALVGNMKSERSVSNNDDGMSQRVEMKAGVHLATTKVVPNPVNLTPYRTFREIEQPASNFVFRVQQTRDGLPACALYEADGGSWKLEAISRISMWLRDHDLNESKITVLA